MLGLVQIVSSEASGESCQADALISERLSLRP